ncbi:DNA-directed RNA polymerase subunit beta' [Dolosigranulum pigrum]|uniref:DNA-directed RNA polymerase subunit beta' n=1 Tax=Dolosigranulum pigrum TaxID=29394 RepID=A0A1S8KPT2_9LACT|nr:DNA-directed RNA polymerase subunit beta' [Dolosigranulum pigrum]OOL81505.1 DNA-directed RNA polymerase subunit beta' [Dolosigranulum pigrum]QJS95807.1 DNA-directed RNA polymerase subunit beta' [Dolosigranulum pigrum]QTJ35281.1 DNA-directed RNA polymerase subunit beta' [Dolosigranulum pigrum]QTJ37033.1 DNA-directed RNA polymerase subunit beta' [Dolosigranulum pigrum]QTJ48934.1 DNA-directed RNA polymerase subunit beta' [Dolosigranulum pigrum]
MVDVNNFESIQIGLASPDKIRSWSRGEVKKPETINYRTLKPEKDGLFCERIFGPTKDYECSCGKYKRVHYKGIVCDRCGVEVTKSSVRRERMGHLELAAPVTHIWYFKGIPSRMGLILDMSPRSLEEIIYFASYVVTDAGDTPLEEKQLLTEREYRQYRHKYGTDFQADIGAEGVRTLLKNLDIQAEIDELKELLQTATGQKRSRAIRRLDILDAFNDSNNKPEWMILDVIPIIPPELRPMVQLEGGRFATSDLNDLYRRVINRNNRLKRLLDLNAPHIIVQNEKRMLQEAVDALVDNGRRGRAVTGPGNRPLKSLSHMLKGKQGRFRQNLLGKRVDYSGRSVIVVGPKLKMYQCGLPKEMALELFKPFVMRELVEREIANNIKNAKRKVERMDESVWNVLEDVIREHPVLLNRAPTLHRLGIQAFEPVLVEGKAIQLHPLACEAYNADFDGDQMAVHVPLSDEAQAEARILMLGAQNILNPKDGKPVVTPSQDMVLGNYYLTMEDNGKQGEGSRFSSVSEAIQAYQTGYVHLHTRVAIQTADLAHKPFTDEQRKQYLVTTVGKLIFNEIMPDEFPYLNEPSRVNLEEKTPDKYFLDYGTDIPKVISEMPLVKPFGKKDLGNIIAQVFKDFQVTETSKMLDRMKNLGYKYSTISGITVGIADISALEEKPVILEKAHAKVDKINATHRRGLITEDERYTKVIEVWNQAKDDIQEALKTSLDRKNNIFMMSDSGARGNISNFTQLAGMRGLMAAPSGEIMELPITSNFREGLSVLEMFISTHGARKGMTDTALKTADSGYLTRRLVDVAQDVIIREEDCGTKQGLTARAIKVGNEVIEPLIDRIIGRYARVTVRHPETDEVIVRENEIITEDKGRQIVDAGIEEVTIRSVFSCNTQHGVCKHCYGRNLATGREVEVGEAVGTIAAQSIGEPGTQLTMRTFHTGGVAGDDITQGLPRVQEIFEARHPKGQATITEVSGEVADITENAEERTKVVTIKGEVDTRSYEIPINARMKVEVGDVIERGDPLNEGSIDPKELLAVSDAETLKNYLLQEVQYAYRSQGVEIGDKHVEVMVRQMLRKVRVQDPGDTDILPGTMIDLHEFKERNKKALMSGGQPATARLVLLGITKASLETDSFLSAASFQETTRVLTDAAIRGKTDNLIGLKENVIIGKNIPAGTGMDIYSSIEPKSVGVVSENVYSINDQSEAIDEIEAVEED